MFSAETIKKLGEVLHISDFDAKLKSDKEETLEVPVLFTEDEKKTFGGNRFEEGKKAGSEILVKSLKEKHGLEVDGKSVDALLSAYAEKVITDAKIEPDKKVAALLTEKKTLQDQINSLSTEKETIAKDLNNKLFQVEIRSEVLSHIPDNTLIPKSDIADLFLNRHRVAKEDNSVITYKGTEKMQDSVLNPIPLKNVVMQFAEGYIKKSGMGGGDNGGGGGAVPKFKTASEAYKYLKDHNIEPMGQEGLKLLNENKDAGFDPNK